MGQRCVESTGLHTETQQVDDTCRTSSTSLVRQRQGSVVGRRRGFFTPLISLSLQRFMTSLHQAHAMLPHLGAGAGQALEDAYVLARLLGHQQTNAVNAPVRAEVSSDEIFSAD